jgi:capsular polysaccharide export protein
LFLQGVISPFFGRLADRLRAEGHGVGRVNFCAGDLLDWGRRPAWCYRGQPAELRPYFEDLLPEQGITDLVLFGDQRPVHRPAIELARERGVRVYVFEEGYVRPNWLTLERDGVNANSALPRDPDWYRAVARQLPEVGEGTPVRSRLWVRAARDLVHHVANGANPLLFPRYRTHRPHHAAIEYAGWVRRFARLPLHRRRDDELIRRLIGEVQRFFLVPLQLNSDVQIRTHSSFAGMPALIETVMKSFAAVAPADTALVIKNHPLDTGLVAYASLIARLAAEFALQGRVHYLETGHLPTLLEHASGVVTVNSTTGLSALIHGRPTLALGNAIYDLPGLTDQSGLDNFWRDGEPPDASLVHAFRNTVIHTTQVNGGFYEEPAIALALHGIQRLLNVPSPLEELLT